MAKKWLQKAIKRPGRIKRLAARKGVSLSRAIEIAIHSRNRSLRAAGILAKRLRKGL